MIGAIRGIPQVIDQNTVLIYAGGIGYEVRITTDDANAMHADREVLLHIVFCLRQEKVELFGFLKPGDKELFHILNNISGIGGKTALTLIGSRQLLSAALAQNDPMLLTQITGIGQKTAEKILVELKHNKKLQIPAQSARLATEAISALVNLGINRNVAARIVHNALESNPDISLENLIKETLAMI